MCDDPTCPGCAAERLVAVCRDREFTPRDIMQLVGLAILAFFDDYEIVVAPETEPPTVH